MESFLAQDTDSEDDMPQGWEAKISSANRVYYVNHNTKITQWYHPLSNKRMVVSAELPDGWIKQTLENGKIIFYNKVKGQSTYTDPRLAIAHEVVEEIPSISKHKDLNAWSTTEDVLQDIDLAGKIAIITGANSGIGFETAKALASRGAHIIMTCRNSEKAIEACQLITASYPDAKLTYIHCDLTSLESVHIFCQQFLSMNLPLDFLILNAAINGMPFTKTGDNIETTFQVNHLSHFYLTRILEKKLIESAPSRVVVVASESHRFSTINTDNINQDWSETDFVSFMAYNDSKLCNLLFANELHRRLYKYNVTVVSCHPGNLVYTNFQRYWWLLRLLYLLAKPFTKSANQGAATVIFCAVSSQIEGCGGLYFNNCQKCIPSSKATDIGLAKLLWNKSTQMVNRVIPLNEAI